MGHNQSYDCLVVIIVIRKHDENINILYRVLKKKFQKFRSVFLTSKPRKRLHKRTS